MTARISKQTSILKIGTHTRTVHNSNRAAVQGLSSPKIHKQISSTGISKKNLSAKSLRFGTCKLVRFSTKRHSICDSNENSAWVPSESIAMGVT